MAAFTTLALLGLAAAGGLTAGKALSDRKATGDQTDSGNSGGGPHAKLGDQPLVPPAPPTDLSLSAGNAALQASNAAARARRKATAGNLLSGPTVNQPGQQAPSSPKSLLGY